MRIELSKEESLKLMNLQFGAAGALSARNSFLESLAAQYKVKLKDVEVNITEGYFELKEAQPVEG